MDNTIQSLSDDLVKSIGALVSENDKLVYAMPLAFIFKRMLSSNDKYGAFLTDNWDDIYAFTSTIAASVMASSFYNKDYLCDNIALCMMYAYAVGKSDDELIDDEAKAMLAAVEEKAKRVIDTMMNDVMLKKATDNSAVQ